MTATKLTPAQRRLLRKVQCETQEYGEEFPVITMMCLLEGLLRRDIHNCLSLTPAGLAALEGEE